MAHTSSSLPEMLTELAAQAVLETIESMGGGPVSRREVGRADAPCDGLCGIVSFVGDLSWSFLLSLPRQTALDLTRAFAGFELEFESADMADAVGELANILGGDLAARLETRGAKAAMSLPTVARGHDVQLLLPHDVSCKRLSFDSAAGGFGLTIAMARPAPGLLSMPGEPLSAAREIAASGLAWRK